MVGGSNPPSATTHSEGLSLLAEAVDHGCRALAVPDEADLVLAVSGGADSMAMLHGAAALVRSGARGWKLTVAHLDHRLRAESASDAAFVRDSCDALGLPFAGAEADVAAAARRAGQSIEEAAREARYDFLGTVRAPDGFIATAHTADDAAETVLINLLRGSGLAGARGIPARRGHVIRPLLGERRAHLRHLLDQAAIAYRDDPSNADPSYLRNRVRAEVLPLLEQIRPGAIDAVLRFARLAAEDDALLDALASDELARRGKAPGEIDWSDPPARALGRRVLRLAIGDPAPSAERLDALLDAVEGPRGGLTIELGGGREAAVRGRRIRLE